MWRVAPVHHPTVMRGSIQGNTNVIVIEVFYIFITNLLNEGGGWYKNVGVGGFVATA